MSRMYFFFLIWKRKWNQYQQLANGQVTKEFNFPWDLIPIFLSARFQYLLLGHVEVLYRSGLLMLECSKNKFLTQILGWKSEHIIYSILSYLHSSKQWWNYLGEAPGLKIRKYKKPNQMESVLFYGSQRVKFLFGVLNF